jgi:hypothetical protein
MTLNSERPASPPGVAEKRSLFGDEDGLFSSIPRQRLQRLASRIHGLGPVALTYLLEELSRGRDLVTVLVVVPIELALRVAAAAERGKGGMP